MSNSRMYTGSIDLTQLMDQASKGNPSISRAKNGHVYAFVVMWENDPNEYGNTHSIQLGNKEGERTYIGNLKPHDNTLNQSDLNDFQNALDSIKNP